MNADERLLALKKAYADIILNTSKEAAERVMVSERKAIQFQYELSVAKQDALHMMLRLKKMMDSKNSEAEMKSRSQQGKIEELEAQLEEAEDIVSDLREELRYVKEKLENVTDIKVQYLDEHDTATVEEASEKKRHNTYQSIKNPLPESHNESFAASNVKTLDLTRKITKCCKELVHMGNSYGDKLEIPSIILRHKRHESCRNGYTQRIHACERDSVSGDLSLSGKLKPVDNERLIGAIEKDNSVHPALTGEAENMCNIEKIEAVRTDNRHSSSYEIEANSSFCGKKNKGTRSRKHRSPPGKQIRDQSVEMIQTLGISSLNTDQTESEENPSDVTQKLSLNITEMGVQPRCSETIKECVRKFYVENKLHSVRPVPAGQVDMSTEISPPKNSKTNPEKIGEPVVKSEFKASKTQVFPSQPKSTRIIKHTFQRKRKREPVSSSDKSISHENSSLKTKREENRDNSTETEKSCLEMNSSQDSRQSPKVSHQPCQG